MKAIELLCVLAATVGCGSAAMPSAKMTDAKSEIKAADAVGAAHVPQAALHLKLARDETARAEALLKQGDEEEADLMLDRARIDAELSMTLARGSQARAEANEASKRIEALSRD
jgi:hypothetical protein